ncbi:23S rRNA (adenine(2030)-N(6))-methyltransferase RlmJ [Zooshikella sp. RANM57]|uniref:23S rRNA (adenine(2030)-N(6))-methyltransferase RlmJ n=1 Tax=Zooshikella sp. RANM57 TaxID=3425863 RepID=UPI003D6FEA70
MLSYRHAFHAGNFADVLKHSVLCLCLEHLIKKEKPYFYLDTHSGAGSYSLTQAKAQQNQEFLNGISQLWPLTTTPSELQPYLNTIHTINPKKKLSTYPGSPLIVQHYLRDHDYMRLYELHPKDHEKLKTLFKKVQQARIEQSDGFAALKSALPPHIKRGIVLIDPSYEIKTEYQTAIKQLIEGYKRFNTGIFLLWYPVVQRSRITKMEQQLRDSKIRNILQIEHCITPDTSEHGMTGSGLFIINPPWQLHTQLTTLLPFLQEKLSPQYNRTVCRHLVPE